MSYFQRTKQMFSRPIEMLNCTAEHILFSTWHLIPIFDSDHSLIQEKSLYLNGLMPIVATKQTNVLICTLEVYLNLVF